MSLKSRVYELQLGLRQSLIGRKYRGDVAREIRIDEQEFVPERLLFLLSGLIGDSVMSVPAIIEARRLWPGARITVLGKKHNRELLGPCPFVDEFFEFNADPFSLRRSPEVKEIQAWLNDANFDAAIILLGNQFAHLLARAGIPVRVGVKGTPLEGCLTHAYEIGSPREWGVRERLNCLRIFGHEIQNVVPKLWVDPDAKVSAREKLLDLGLAELEKYVVIHPFGSTPRQWWNLERIRPLARMVEELYRTRSVLIGGPETAGVGAFGESVIDTRGRLNLRELVAIIGGAERVITTDSGPFHIAGALGKSTVGLFRARRPEHAKAYPTANVLLGASSLCDRACEWDRCSIDPCRQMESIDIDPVFNALRLEEVR
jgi:ADP-heptose:LPS heptosyltransferase